MNTVTVDPLGRVIDELEASDDGAHIICCRPYRSLCGADLDIGEVAEGTPAEECCIRCLVIEDAGVPCGAPFCRLRRRLPWRWS